MDRSGSRETHVCHAETTARLANRRTNRNRNIKKHLEDQEGGSLWPLSCKSFLGRVFVSLQILKFDPSSGEGFIRTGEVKDWFRVQ